jgi:hypothetical protein
VTLDRAACIIALRIIATKTVQYKEQILMRINQLAVIELLNAVDVSFDENSSANGSCLKRRLWTCSLYC